MYLDPGPREEARRCAGGSPPSHGKRVSVCALLWANSRQHNSWMTVHFTDQRDVLQSGAGNGARAAPQTERPLLGASRAAAGRGLEPQSLGSDPALRRVSCVTGQSPTLSVPPYPRRKTV